jgi:iron complex outermembrane receptor protein
MRAQVGTAAHVRDSPVTDRSGAIQGEIMNRETAHARRAAKLVALLGTASFAAMFGTAANAADAVAAPVEEILITGSIIRGAPAVGVPVTAFGEEDFRESGSVTVSDMLRSLPSVDVAVNQSITTSGAVNQKPQEVAIRNLATGAGTETLMMINGMRFPVQGFSSEYVDPSIVSALGVQRIDVLAEGASATYGSDAVAGVINVVLRRGYNGAISQLRYARSTDIGIPAWTFNQLYGRSWDSGQVTVSFQWSDEAAASGRVRDYFTLNFEPYGFDDRRPTSTSNPANLHIGNATTPAGTPAGFAATRGTRFCSNCFSIPAGTGWNYGDTVAHTNPTAPGSAPTTTWASILANPGVQNLHEPTESADVVPRIYNARATLTFDQTIADDVFGVAQNVNLFVDAFYSNHRTTGFYTPGASPGSELLLSNVTVPTNNPYRPTGAPGNLRADYNLAFEMGGSSRLNTAEVASRYAFGFEADLPYEWRGRVYYSKSEDKNYVHVTNMVNTNHVRAALGQTVTPNATQIAEGLGPFTKPANVPYLNILCDATVYQCNSQATLDYIRGIRNYDQHFNIAETGFNLDGPLFDLPGGPLMAGVAGNYRSDHYFRQDTVNYTEYTTSIYDRPTEPDAKHVWALVGQLNIPIIGEANALPLVEAFEIQAGYRLDRYQEQGDIKTPKVSARWQVGYGLVLRGAWGKAFRAPSVAEASTYSVQVQGVNVASGEPGNDFALDCTPVAGQPNSTTAGNPGSLVALLNPTCSQVDALRYPAGVDLAGGAGVSGPVRTGPAVGPENARSWSAGFNFTPTEGFLSGLNVDATWYKLRINDLLTGRAAFNSNDPQNVLCTDAGTNCNYVVRANPLLPITDPANATFFSLVQAVIANPRSTVKDTSNIQFIHDGAVTNVGWRELTGIDFDVRYDFELANWGFWNVGIRGDYRLTDKTLPSDAPGTAVDDAFDGNTGGRLRWRGRLGWSQGDEGFSVVGFLNYRPHGSPANTLPPACYWQTGFSAGSCYSGSPFFGPYDRYPLYSPAQYWLDLTVAYNTGEMFANNPYLQNLNLSMTVNNIFNRQGPFTYTFGSNRGTAADQNALNGYLQRYISFTITKNW